MVRFPPHGLSQPGSTLCFVPSTGRSVPGRRLSRNKSPFWGRRPRTVGARITKALESPAVTPICAGVGAGSRFDHGPGGRWRSKVFTLTTSATQLARAWKTGKGRSTSHMISSASAPNPCRRFQLKSLIEFAFAHRGQMESAGHRSKLPVSCSMAAQQGWPISRNLCPSLTTFWPGRLSRPRCSVLPQAAPSGRASISMESTASSRLVSSPG